MQNPNFAARAKKRGSVRRIFLLLVLFLIGMLLLMRPMMIKAKQHHLKTAATMLISETVEEVLAVYGREYFSAEMQDNRITAVYFDAQKASDLKLYTEQALCQKLDAGVRYRFSEPLGTYLGSELFMTAGPEIPVEALLLGDAETALGTDIQSVGINQTRYRLQLSVVCHLQTSLSYGAKEITVSGVYTAAEWVIVGEVPRMGLNYVEGSAP